MFGEKIALEYEVLGFDPNATLISSSRQPAKPSAPSLETYRVEPENYGYQPPEPQLPGYYESQAQQPYPPPAPAPVYSGNVPPGPADVYGAPAEAYEMEPEAPQRSRTWLYVGCGVLLVMLCCVVAGAFIFDYLDLYCTAPFNIIFSCP